MTTESGRQLCSLIFTRKLLNLLLPLILITVLLFSAACLCAPTILGREIHLEKIRLPPGFEVSLYTDKVLGPV